MTVAAQSSAFGAGIRRRSMRYRARMPALFAGIASAAAAGDVEFATTGGLTGWVPGLVGTAVYALIDWKSQPISIEMLLSRAEQLGDHLEDEMKADKPPSMKLSRTIAQMSADLDAHQIPHPNWHSLDRMPILAWMGYVDRLLPTLRRRNLSEARDAINHVDMARGLKP